MEPAHLKPGALVAHIGQVSLVQDYLWVRYPYASLVDVPTRLLELTDQLHCILDDLENDVVKPVTIHVNRDAEKHREPINRAVQAFDNIKRMVTERIKHLHDSIVGALEDYEGVHVQNRTKRGLVDGIGELSKLLFGTATVSDVNDLKERYNDLADFAMVTNKTVQLNCQNIARLDNNLHVMINYTNILREAIYRHTTVMDFLLKDSEVTLALPMLENALNSILRTNDQVIKNLVDGSIGRVTSSLLPVKDLRHTLEIAKKKYDLTPIFEDSNILHYYPLLNSMLSKDSIIIHIPFKSDNVFDVHRIEPFPFAVNSSIMTLNLPSSVVLVKQDHSFYATGVYEDLTECKTERLGAYFCPASLFTFLPVQAEGICEVILTQWNASRSLSLCPYTHLVPRPFFHKSFMGHHYFLFTEPMDVSVTCLGGTMHKRVSGHFAILKLCSLHSPSITTHSEKLHEGFVAPNFARYYPLRALKKLNFTSIKYVTNTIAELKFSNFSELESAVHESMPTYLRPYVHYPSIVTPIIIVIVILIPLIFLVRKALSLYKLLRARANAGEGSHTSTPGQG